MNNAKPLREQLARCANCTLVVITTEVDVPSKRLSISRCAPVVPICAAALVALSPAVGSAVGVRVCVSATNDESLLWDYSPHMDGRDLLEDYGRRDQKGSLAVPGMLTSVTLDESRLWGWAPLDHQGCTTQFDAPPASELEIEAYFWSYNADTNVSVVSLNCAGDLDCTSGGASILGFVPPAGGTLLVSLGNSRRSYVHFAAATAEARVPTTTDVVYYTRTGIDLMTISNRVAGGQPTASIGGESFRSKFTVAHEFGHLKTLIAKTPTFSNANVDYCYGNPKNCSLTWVPDSPEWQSAAAIEGFADFFSMLVWNDAGGAPRDGVKAWASSQKSWRCRYAADPSEQGVPPLPDDCIPQNSGVTTIADSWHHQANCDPINCPSGVAAASDWAFALWDMRVLTSVPDGQLLDLLRLSYPWPTNGENSAYWDEFILDIAGPGLSGNDLVAWLEFAHTRGIDR